VTIAPETAPKFIMSSAQPLPSSVLLAKGIETTVTLNSGAIGTPVKVRMLPSRHLSRFIDLRDVGFESELLEFVLQRGLHKAGEQPLWHLVDLSKPEEVAAQREFVDDLSDEDHTRLVELADQLNFSRAVSQSERQIAIGTALMPLKQRVSQTMMKPVEAAMKSLTSSLVTQLSAAVGKTLP
jgi:hypothetical protein